MPPVIITVDQQVAVGARLPQNVGAPVVIGNSSSAEEPVGKTVQIGDRGVIDFFNGGKFDSRSTNSI